MPCRGSTPAGVGRRQAFQGLRLRGGQLSTTQRNADPGEFPVVLVDVGQRPPVIGARALWRSPVTTVAVPAQPIRIVGVIGEPVRRTPSRCGAWIARSVPGARQWESNRGGSNEEGQRVRQPHPRAPRRRSARLACPGRHVRRAANASNPSNRCWGPIPRGMRRTQTEDQGRVCECTYQTALPGPNQPGSHRAREVHAAENR